MVLCLAGVISGIWAFASLVVSFCIIYECVYDRWTVLSPAAAIPAILLFAIPLLALAAVFVVFLGSAAVLAAGAVIPLWPTAVVGLLVLILMKK